MPVAILIWLMIYPMMLKIDFTSIKNATKGNSAYTLVQVAVNDLILLVGFVPIVTLLLRVTDVVVPMDTLFISVILFVIIPFVAGYLSRVIIIKKKGLYYFESVFLSKFNGITVVGLLLTLVILFAFQGQKIIDNPLHIALIAIPLTIQTFFIFFLPYLWAKIWKLPHDIAAPGAMIGASNFFELAVAIANKTRHWFKK